MLALGPVDEGRNFEFLRLNQQWAASLIEAHLPRPGEATGAEPQPAPPDARRALEAALEALSTDEGIAFFALARRSALTALESQVMGLCLAQMIEPEVGRALARLHPHGRPQLTPADVALLVLGNTPEARTQILMLLSAEARLRTARILEAPQLTWDGLIDSPLYLTRPCLAYLTGQALHAPHYGFTRFAHDEAARSPTRAVVAEQQAEQIYDVVASQAAYLDRRAADGAWILVLLWGPPGAGKGTFARELASQLFAGLVELDGEAVMQLEAPHALVREALCCAVIHGAMLLIENGQALLRSNGAGRLLLDGLRASPACVVVTSTERELGQALEGAWSLVSRFDPPGRELGVELWSTHLPPGIPLTSDVDLEALAERYALPGAAIARAARMAAAYSAADPEPRISMALLEWAAAAQLDDDLGDWGRTVRPAHPLEDLILPAAELQQIQAMIAACNDWPHVMSRWGLGNRLASGKCITGLFHGEPGTGKAFAAEVVASAVGRPLRIVNLSRLVSLEGAEAERGLRELFARARRAGAVLLLEDASAAGARVDAHDRALITRAEQLRDELERHAGLVIMTTSQPERLDPVLRRRVVFGLEFAPPDEDARWRIWQRMIPAQAPCAADVDLAALARGYALSAGEIKNAVLRASLAAYADGGELTQRHLTDACEPRTRSGAP